MAEAAQTGMDKAAMRKLLTEAKAEPVQCVIGSGKDQSVGLLLMHRTKMGKALEKQLIDDIPETKNTRWGTVKIDEEDAKQANFYLNRPISGAARRLVKTLKGTGFSKVKIMLEDGTAVEGANDEEAPETLATAGQPQGAAAEPQDEAPRPGLVPPPPPPPPAAAEAAQDASALARRLAELAPRIPQAAAGDDAKKAELLKLATQVNVNIKTNNLTYAATYLDQLAAALGAPPPPPPPAAAAPAQDSAALGRQLAALIQRVSAVSDPARKAELAKLAGMANVNIKTNNLTYAATSIAQLARALDEAAAAPAAAPKAAFEPSVLTKSGRDWLATRQAVEDEMERLRATIQATYEGRPVAAEIDKSFRQRTAPVLRTLDASLAVKLSAASKADAAGQPALLDEARVILADYEKFAADPLLADLDDNPFAALSIRQTLTGSLGALASSLR